MGLKPELLNFTMWQSLESIVILESRLNNKRFLWRVISLVTQLLMYRETKGNWSAKIFFSYYES